MLYSYNGRQWKDADTTLLAPAVGNQKVMRDASMVQSPDGMFHLVWTSSWRGDNGFGYASSKDLVHWSPQRFIPVMEKEPSVVNVWAPEIFYDDVQQQYIIIWASCIPGRFNKGIEADSNNHRMYYTTTTDFASFSNAKLFFDPGYSVIDAVIVKRASNNYVLVFKDNTRPERNLKVAFGTSPLGPWNNISPAFTPQFTEGPSVLKMDNSWWIYYDAYQKKTYDAVITADFIHFTDAGTKVSLPPGHKHGTIVSVKRTMLSKWLYAIKK